MPGDIIYAEARLDNNNIEMFRFESRLGDHKYFNSQGESIRKTLMKTPIDGARLSSGFGRRTHPVLGIYQNALKRRLLLRKVLQSMQLVMG